MTFKTTIEHIRQRRNMYGYGPECFFTNLMREIVTGAPEQAKGIQIFNHRDSFLLRLIGKGITPDASDFILNRDWEKKEYDEEENFPSNFHLFVTYLLAWGKYFRLKSIRNGMATQILFKQAQFQKRCSFPTERPDSWEIYFKLDPELSSNHSIKDFSGDWIKTLLTTSAVFYPQYCFEHNHCMVLKESLRFTYETFPEMQEWLGILNSEKFDCIIGHCPNGNGLKISSFVNGFATPNGGSHEKYFTRLLKRVFWEEFPEKKCMLKKLCAVINYKEKMPNLTFCDAAFQELSSEINISRLEKRALKRFIKEECADTETSFKQHSQLARVMYGYGTELFFPRFVAAIVSSEKELTKEIRIYYHENSIRIRVFGNSINSEFLRNNLELKMANHLFAMNTLPKYFFYIHLFRSWGERFIIKNFQSGICQQLIFKKTELKKQKTFSTDQLDGWEIFFELDLNLPTNWRKNIIIREWIDNRYFNVFAALYPQYRLKLNGKYLSGGLKHLLDCDASSLWEFHSEKIDCIIGCFSPEKDRNFRLDSFVNGFYTPQGGTHEKYFCRVLKRAFQKIFPGKTTIARNLCAIVHYKSADTEETIFSNTIYSELVSKIKIPKKDQIALRKFIIKDCLEKI